MKKGPEEAPGSPPSLQFLPAHLIETNITYLNGVGRVQDELAVQVVGYVGGE